MKQIANVILFVVVLLGSASVAIGQTATGIPAFSSTTGGIDNINLGNLNANISIPVINKAGLIPFHYALAYDSSVWYPVTVNGNKIWQYVGNFGWHSDTDVVTGYLTYVRGQTKCWDDPPYWYYGVTYGSYAYHDAWGAVHRFDEHFSTCADDPGPTPSLASDGSGYTLDTNGPGGSIRTKGGELIVPPAQGPTGSATAADANGNQITVTGSTFTDTLGLTALTIGGSGTAGSPKTFTYTPPNGTPVAVTLNYTTKSVKTYFQCNTSPNIVADVGPMSIDLVTSVGLPDGTSYGITYEQTPGPGNSGYVTGRIASITLPTGGVISYTYTGSNNGINCADGSALGLSRTTPDSGTPWQYSRTNVGGTTQWTTTVTDPAGNRTVLNFQQSAPNFYETKRQIYQGTSTLLETVLTCYNGSASPCDTTAVGLPITQRAVTLQWPNNGRQSKTVANYDSTYTLVTEVDEYGYGTSGPGPLARQTLTTYATLSGIVDHPASVTVKDGSGTTVAQTSYGYDTHGNTTSVSQLVSTGFSLARSFTYNANGTVATATDVNSAVTTYAYGTGSCNGAFPTSVTPQLLPARTMTWDCTGGVQLTATDENTKSVGAAYSDSYFWRPASVSDQLTNLTSFSYPSATQVQSSMSFASSVTESLTTLDSLGRPHISQRRQGPSAGSYDSVQTDYDSLGRPFRSTLPYSDGAGVTHGGPWSATTTFDPLGRPTHIEDSGSPTKGTVDFTYVQNDILQSVNAPSGENAKQKNLEYDAVGRLTSVCELTSSTNGGGSCTQSSPQIGYYTTYTYAGNQLTVYQNAQSGSPQMRQYTYDLLGRMTSEANPETGTIIYTYDSDATCTPASNGDLIKRVDAMGNTTCYQYDALHRVTAITYPSGSYASNTPRKYFTYDLTTATIGGTQTTIANSKGRLSRAYTQTGCPSTCVTKTDEYFSYSARGEVTDTWESTPNSGGYYHTTASYWANGVLNTLALVGLGLPSFSYSLDTQGRPNVVTTSSGTSPIPSGTPVTYNVFGQVVGLTFGSGDSDSFGYDGYTGRMSQYQYSVGASPSTQTVTGNLTWNANGTLRQLAITDQLNSANTQTCTYGYDDLVRIGSVSCANGATSIWGQTFTYDPYGNLKKHLVTGYPGVPFEQNYDLTKNRVSDAPFNYDANGNTTHDNVRSYTWDAEGKALTADTVGLIYDALGRMVESGITQIVYAPTGQKFALMNGQTVSKAFVPLPGGGQAVYSGTTLAYFRHPDWLGSSRLASNPDQTPLFDLAYAPYGETYAEYGSVDNRSFAGMNQDTIQGSPAALYDAVYREYGMYGRWISPDPAGAGAVDVTSPQTWNRYAYVANNPLAYGDPLGLCPPPGVYAKGCVYVQYPGGDSLDCTIEGMRAPCGLAFSLLHTEAGYLVEADGGDCAPSSHSGRIYCGPQGETPYKPGAFLFFFSSWVEDFSTGTSIGNEDCSASSSSIDDYLKGKNSPMAGQGSNFMASGQKYNLDPRLLVSLSGAETTFGKNITAGQNNALNVLYNKLNSPYPSFQANINAAGRSITNPANRYNLTNTSTMYSTYCSGPLCTKGLNNLNTFMREQGARTYVLHNPCKSQVE